MLQGSQAALLFALYLSGETVPVPISPFSKLSLDYKLAYANLLLGINDTNGKLSLAGASHGRKKGLKQLASFYEKAHAENSNFALIGHADSEKDADRVCELLAKQDESVTVIKHDIGATIGSHVGAGMVSISFWGTDRREALSVADKIARKVRKGE